MRAVRGGRIRLPFAKCGDGGSQFGKPAPPHSNGRENRHAERSNVPPASTACGDMCDTPVLASFSERDSNMSRKWNHQLVICMCILIVINPVSFPSSALPSRR
jgi:hypothetical protein